MHVGEVGENLSALLSKKASLVRGGVADEGGGGLKGIKRVPMVGSSGGGAGIGAAEHLTSPL